MQKTLRATAAPPSDGSRPCGAGWQGLRLQCGALLGPLGVQFGGLALSAHLSSCPLTLRTGSYRRGGAWLPGRPKWLGHPAAPRVALRRGPLDGKARRLLPFQGRGRPDRHGLGNAALHFPSADRCIRRPFSIFPPALASGLFKLFGRLLVSSSDPPAASIKIPSISDGYQYLSSRR